MFTSAYGSVLVRRGTVSLIAIALGMAACSSNKVESGVGAEARTATVAAPLTGTSCQALDVATHENTNYAINLNGDVLGWGANSLPFPLGHTSTDPVYPLDSVVKSPKPLGISGAKQLAAHSNGACALLTDTTVECWGQPLGNDLLTPSQPLPPPARVKLADGTTNLSGVVGISAGGKHVCAWKSDHTAWCWGDDLEGQLGDGSDPNGFMGTGVTYPIQMLNAQGAGLTDVAQIAAAGSSTCVLRTNGEVDCAGRGTEGELGQGGGANTLPDGGPIPQGQLVPVTVPVGTTFASVTGGGVGTFCASSPIVNNTQTTYCWGMNAQGQAVIKNTQGATSPTPISTDVGAKFAQGDVNGCEANGAGGVTCWGMNGYGQISTAAGDIGRDYLAQTAIPNVDQTLKLAIGNGHICALSLNGLSCWGNNDRGQIGNGPNAPASATAPTKVRISVPPPAACIGAAGARGSQCGVVNANTCGESTDCGACSIGNLCTNNVCTKDPNYCNPGCSSDQFCDDGVCHTHCGTNAPDASWTLQYGTGFSATSGASYGSSGCEQRYIVDMKNTSGFEGHRVYASFPPGSITQAQCVDNNNAPLARVTLTTYVDGNKVSTVGPVYSRWVNAGGLLGAYCDWSDANAITIPAGHGNARVVAKLERNNYHPEKQQRLWELAPVNVTFFAVR